VETDEHCRVLLEMGCDIGQGYGIARPMPAGEFAQWRQGRGMETAEIR
jgi:EAL domain-containing protein (putative c-di-GMP-specific phosphodiesterase class I)